MAKKEDKEKKNVTADEDWKEQARKEKEILAAQQKAEQEKKEQFQGRPALPKGDFTGLVSMLATQSLLAMGAVVPEGQERKEPDLELAKYHIDILEAIEEKTKGNLSEQETALVTEALHQIRMLYVKVAEAKGAS
jgi:hypothetical protein